MVKTTKCLQHNYDISQVALNMCIPTRTNAHISQHKFINFIHHYHPSSVSNLLDLCTHPASKSPHSDKVKNKKAHKRKGSIYKHISNTIQTQKNYCSHGCMVHKFIDSYNYFKILMPLFILVPQQKQAVKVFSNNPKLNILITDLVICRTTQVSFTMGALKWFEIMLTTESTQIPN